MSDQDVEDQEVADLLEEVSQVMGALEDPEGGVMVSSFPDRETAELVASDAEARGVSSDIRRMHLGEWGWFVVSRETYARIGINPDHYEVARAELDERRAKEREAKEALARKLEEKERRKQEALEEKARKAEYQRIKDAVTKERVRQAKLDALTPDVSIKTHRVVPLDPPPDALRLLAGGVHGPATKALVKAQVEDLRAVWRKILNACG